MDTNTQVILILKMAMNIAPPALYFVVLGLVNSQSRPHLISSRNDWLTLMIVFCPVLIFPALWLAAGGHYLIALLALGLSAVGMVCSLPRGQSGWVIYNCSHSTSHNALRGALDEAGIEYEVVNSNCLYLPQYRTDIRLSGLPLLKNTSIGLSSDRVPQSRLTAIEETLRRRLDEVENAINPSGPAFLLAGTSMLIFPLLMMVRHMDAFVKVVCDLWPV